MQSKPKKMRISVEGALGKGVTSKDIILYIISKISAAGATGYFVEYAGSTIRSLSMEARMTICNMSIEMGARGGLIAPDQTTYDFLKGKQYAPAGEDWEKAVAYWNTLRTDDGAVFDQELTFDAADIEPMITYGTNPGMGIKVVDNIPTTEGMEGSNKTSYLKALDYMGFAAGEPILGKSVDYVFVGSCTNGRIEDIRAVAQFVKGHKKADSITAWIVPGSREVEKMAHEEGLVKILEDAGFELRQPGCSACLAMNDDKIPAGKYAVSTSNRNFEGRQGPGARTLLASPLTVAAVAITGRITDPREVF
jgi:3-isopropylmalate/(R)-2-methylmalate dehydratase large subunit